METESRLKYFPISFFSMILGLSGFTIAFQRAEHILHLPFSISNVLLYLTVSVFLFLFFVYATKVLKHREAVRQEFNHPIKLNFFPTITISFLLLSVVVMSYNVTISKYLWWIGTVSHFLLSLKIISIWIQHTKFDINHMNPAWFIPAVGNIIVPVAGVQHATPEISWLFFSVGLIFWIILLVLFFNRIIFHNPLPDKLLPTLFILIAPPAVGFISHVKLHGEITDFSKILYYFALFMLFVLVSQLKMFSRIKFFLSWWAYSFPISAITISSILMYHQTDILFFKYLAFILLFVLTAVIILLIIKTIQTVINKGICIKED